jgi:predicted nucleotidyltransferase component of viral defense system
MSKEKPRNVSASVRARLTEFARKRGEEFQLVLTRYAIERFLYRLSVSPHGDGFVLKGATLFQLWAAEPHRATKDVDLLGTGESSVERLADIVRAVCSVAVEEDGLDFDPAAVTAGRIKEDQEYEGVRVTCPARLGQARVALQIDVGFGDAITPAPSRVDYPTILDFPPPVLKAYPKETVVAEKFQAMVALGMTNSRMKDFFDLWVLSRNFAFDGATLTSAIAATFRRRRSVPPTDPPLALTGEFGTDPTKVKQWEAFVRKGRLKADATKLVDVIAFLEPFLMPPSRSAAAGEAFTAMWSSGGPWTQASG